MKFVNGTIYYHQFMKITQGGGCWFCPNSKIKEFAELKVHHPHLWQELEKLNKIPNKVSVYFMRNKTFEQVNAEVDAYIKNNQMQIKIDI